MVPVRTDESGFSLVEFLVAMVILSVGILGLLQAVNIAISHNMTNQLRLDATLLADAELSRELSKGGTSTGFDAISTPTSPHVSNYPVRRQVMSGFRSYSVTRTNTVITDNTKQIAVQVRWRYKGAPYTHEASSLISRKQ